MQPIDDYAEENRQALLDLSQSVDSLTNIIKEQYKTPEIKLSDDLNVRGELTVNTEPEVEVENLDVVTDSLEDLSVAITTAIKDYSYKPYKEVTVKNIKDALPTEVKINNLTDMAKYFTTLSETIKDHKPIVNVTKQDVVFPTSASKPVSVRLSDGKSFINQLVAAVGNSTGETDPLVGFQPSDIDDSGSPKYYGFVKANGSWYIMRESSGAYRYATGDKNSTIYSTKWTDRGTLTYSYFYEVF